MYRCLSRRGRRAALDALRHQRDWRGHSGKAEGISAGIYGAGKTMDETFGLIETVEKAAQIYMLTAHLPRLNTIQDREMKELAEFFGVNYRKDFLNL